MHKKSRKFQGFTLIEVLVAVFLGTILIITAYSVYLMSYRSYKKSASNAELAQNARISLERMTRDIRQAREIVTVLPPTDNGSAPSALKFQDGHATTKIQYLTYSLSGTDLYRSVSHYYCSNDAAVWVNWQTTCVASVLTEQNDSAVVKAEHISGLKFWGSNPITAHLTVSNDNNSYQFETKSYPRNIQ